MEKQTHAAEPWRVSKEPHGVFIVSESFCIAKVGDTDTVDAARIVDCVNAFAGIDKPGDIIWQARENQQQLQILRRLLTNSISKLKVYQKLEAQDIPPERYQYLLTETVAVMDLYAGGGDIGPDTVPKNPLGALTEYVKELTEQKNGLHALVKEMRAFQRIGAEKDDPEGSRYVQISDTLFTRICDDLAEIAKLKYVTVDIRDQKPG